jgi:hypothetical protein
MALEEGESWIVRNEIDCGALIARNIDYVLEHTGSALVFELRYFKRVTVQMNGVRIFTLILQNQAITSARPRREWISVRKGLFVYCPAIETSAAAGTFPKARTN